MLAARGLKLTASWVAVGVACGVTALGVTLGVVGLYELSIFMMVTSKSFMSQTG
jgi:hypothetical protein